MKLTAFLLAALTVAAQSLVPSAAQNTVTAGKPLTITAAYTSGGTFGAAALEWSLGAGTGVIGAWTAGASATAAGKSVTCSTAGTVCVLAGLNTNILATGPVASTTVTFPAATRGSQAIAISGASGADAVPNGFTVSGNTINVTVTSPFDLDGSGKVDAADLILVIQQILGITPCTTADFDGDGKCDVVDLMRFVADALSATP